jgi:hypothetical protein
MARTKARRIVLAVLNVFRTEVLIGLWLVRTLARISVRSWRESFPDPKKPFPWAIVAHDRREAYENMLPLSYFGMGVLGVLGVLLFGAPARLLGFPAILELLGYMAVAVPCLVTLMAYFNVRMRLNKLRDSANAPAGKVSWDVDIEQNRGVLLGSSICGIVIAALVACAFLVLLPDPSTWGAD